MLSYYFILSVLAVSSLTHAAPCNHHKNGTGASTTKAAKAIYFITNDAQNAVIALKVNADGTLSEGSTTLTGGQGASGIDGAKNTTAGPDALFSQSAVKADGNMLVAVNAGSNTLSLFSISSTSATTLTLIGSPISTFGDFPNTATLSTKKSLACVANSGAKAGVACYRISKAGLTPLSQSMLTTFDLAQSTPPVGPVNTVSHALFNADASALITTVKGNPATNTTGFISVLPFDANGCPAAKDIRSSPKGTAVLFGSVIIPSTDSTAQTLLATDASFGATTLSLSAQTQQFTALSRTTIADQAATCWAAFSPLTQTAFVTDVGVNHLVETNPQDGAILQSTTLPNTNPGMIDLAAAGNFIYALSPASLASKTNVVVVDVSARPATQVQSFEVGAVGRSAMGMTVGF